MMLQKGNKFKKGKKKRSTFEDDESNKFINCIKTYWKTLNDKILKQRSYYSDGRIFLVMERNNGSKN
jgi:hypothetical protein